MFGHKKTLRIPSFQSPHATVAPTQPQNRQDERKARMKGPPGIWDEFNARPQEPAPTIANSLFTKSKSAAPHASTSTLAATTSKETNPFIVQPIEQDTKQTPLRIRSASFRPSVGPTHAAVAAADVNANSELKAFLGSGNSAELEMTEWSKKKGKEKVRSISREYSPRRSRSRSVRPEPIPETIEETTISRIQLSPSDISTPATANATTAATTISPPRPVKPTSKAGKKRAISEVDQPLDVPPPAKTIATKRKSKSVSVVPEVAPVVVVEKKGAKGKRAIGEVETGVGEVVVAAPAKKPRATKAKKVVEGLTEEEEWARVSGAEKVSKKGKEKAVVALEVETEAPLKKAATKKKVTKQIEPVVEAQEESVIVEEPILKKKASKKIKSTVELAATPPAKSGKRQVDLAESEDHSPIGRKQKSTNAVASSSKVTLDVQESPKKGSPRKMSKVAKVEVVKKKVVKKVARAESSPRQAVTEAASPKAKSKAKSTSKPKSASAPLPAIGKIIEQAVVGGYDFEEERLVSNQGKLNLMDLLGAGIAEMLRQELETAAPGAATKSLESYRDRVRLFFLTQSDRLSALTAVAAKVNSAKSRAKLLRTQLEAQGGT